MFPGAHLFLRVSSPQSHRGLDQPTARTPMKIISRTQRPVFCLLALLVSLTSASAAEIRKANNAFPLDDGLSWIGGIAPTNTDVAVWDADSGSPSSPLADMHWQGIRMLENPFLGGVTIPGGPYTLTLGDAGIDMSAVGGNLDFYCSFVSLDADQVWNIGPGRVVTVYPENGPGTGALYKTGAGTLKLYFGTAASRLSDTAALGLAGGTVQLEGLAYAEVVGSAQVYGDATRVMQTTFGSTLVLNNLTRSVGGTVDFAQAGSASTSTPNDSSQHDGILGGWATVEGHYWAQRGPGGGNQPINKYPDYYWVTDLYETNNVNLPGPNTVTNERAINSLRFDNDIINAMLVLGPAGAYSLTNLTGGILMGALTMNASIVSSATTRTLRGPPGGDLIYHTPFLGQLLSNQVVIADNAICGLTKCGEGTLLLVPGANNSYAGLTTISGGTLQTGNVPNRRYVSTSMRINPNGTYLHGAGDNNLTLTHINVNGGVLNLNGTGDSCPSLILGYNGLVSGFNAGKIFTVGNASTPVDARWGQIDVRLNAPGGLVKTTDRKVALSRASSLTGDTRIENGSLQITSNATVTAGNLIIGTPTNNAKLILGGTNGSGGDMYGTIIVTNLTVLNPGPLIGATIVGGSTLANDNKLTLDFSHDDVFDLLWLGSGSLIENNVTLNKTGAGTLTLTNGTPLTGAIRVEGGTLKLSSTFNVHNHVVEVVGGLLDVNGFGSTFTLNGGGNVNNGANSAVTLTLGGGFSGVISDGNGMIAVIADGLALAASNTYSGTTIVTNGGLFLDADAVPGSGTIQLAGGNLGFTASRTVPVPNPLDLTADTYITANTVGDAFAEFSSSSITGGAGKLTFVNSVLLMTNLFEPRFSGNFAFHRPIGITNSIGLPQFYTGKTRLASFNTNGTIQIYNGVISGNGSFRRSATGGLGGVTALTAANTYSGETLVDNGTLIVNGVIGTNIVTVTNLGTLGGNGTIRGPVLVHNGGTLSAGTSIGRLVISNALTFASGSTNFVELNKTTSTNDLVRGLTSVIYGGTLVVEVLSGTLAANDSFKLFDATSYSGAFTNIIPATPGAGLAWNTSSLVTNGTLRVDGAATPPHIDGVTLSGGNFIVSGSGGVTNGSYYVLTSTNIAHPGINWVVLATNVFDGNGNFTFTNAVSPITPRRFFRLELSD